MQNPFSLTAASRGHGCIRGGGCVVSNIRRDLSGRAPSSQKRRLLLDASTTCGDYAACEGSKMESRLTVANLMVVGWGATTVASPVWCLASVVVQTSVFKILVVLPSNKEEGSTPILCESDPFHVNCFISFQFGLLRWTRMVEFNSVGWGRPNWSGLNWLTEADRIDSVQFGWLRLFGLVWTDSEERIWLGRSRNKLGYDPQSCVGSFGLLLLGNCTCIILLIFMGWFIICWTNLKARRTLFLFMKHEWIYRSFCDDSLRFLNTFLFSME